MLEFPYLIDSPAIITFITAMHSRDARVPDQIISGGQTGVDRAALDIAIELGIVHGGWCPRGRRAEDGCIPPGYRLRETNVTDYAERTRRNVEEADGTLILNQGELQGGTEFTAQYAALLQKPLLIVDLDQACSPDTLRNWLAVHQIHILNIAGPRESKSPGIYQKSMNRLRMLLTGVAHASTQAR
jgi:Predicted Rossmann fold nucleotide-binding protein involved in DNA uptake